MKILKVICVILCCVMITAFLQGCDLFSNIPARLKMLSSEVTNMEKSNLEISKDLLGCFSENDAEGLKDLLCIKTQGLMDIDEQILAGFDFFKGRVISFNEHLLGYEGESVDHGKIIRLERSWSVEDIVTDEDEVYEIYINAFIIYENDKNREGITQITITNSDGTEKVIGYKWPLYGKEGRDMSYEVVKKFDEKDMDGLKAMFCAKTLEIANIDQQIQSGFDLIKGKATYGKVGTINGRDLYDGKHGYHTSVSDNETVENGKPTRTSIEVLIENIETDTGNIYRIKFYAYLLYKGDKTYEGISQIEIMSDDGREEVIGERLD